MFQNPIYKENPETHIQEIKGWEKGKSVEGLSDEWQALVDKLRKLGEWFTQEEMYDLLSQEEGFLYTPFIEAFWLWEKVQEVLNISLNS